MIVWGKELKGSDESKQERNVVQVEILIADSVHTVTLIWSRTGRVRMVHD